MTHECANDCPVDPQWPGLVSCFCKKTDPVWSANQPFAFQSKADPLKVDLKLHIDTDRDETWDAEYFANPALNSGRDQMRVSTINIGTARVDWEDKPTGPEGDFNDVSFLITARECLSEPDGFPVWTFPSDGVGFVCANICPFTEECLAASDDQLRVSATVTVDQLSPEWWQQAGHPDRDIRGRLVSLIVEVFGAPPLAGTRAVLCPSLIFDSTAGAPRNVGYGYSPIYSDSSNFMNACEDCCDPVPGASGEPVCAPQDDSPVPLNWRERMSLSRDQYFAKNTCVASRSGDGDAFDFPNPVASPSGCNLQMPHTEIYEVPLSEIDAVFGTSLAGAPDQAVLDFIVGVDLNMITNLRQDPFFCPSGANLVMTDVDRATFGDHIVRNIPVNSSDLSYRETTRP